MVHKQLALSETQQGIYFDCQTGDPAAYLVSAVMQADGLEAERLEQALTLLVHEQEALRCRVELVDGIPLLQVRADTDCALGLHDLGAAENRDLELARLLEEIVIRPMTWDEALFRVEMIRLDPASSVLVLSLHHIIGDGISLDSFKTKLLRYYRLLESGEPIDLVEDAGFTDFLRQESGKLASGAYDRHKGYWTSKLAGAEPIGLPYDFPLSGSISGRGRELRFEMDEALTERIGRTAMEYEVTPFLFVLAGFCVLMSAYSGSEDIAFTSPFSHRPKIELEETVGCFVHMLPLRFQARSDVTFAELLAQASTEFVGCYKHIGYPNNRIVRESGLSTVPGSPSLFDISFVYDAYESDGNEPVGLLEDETVTFPGTLMAILNKTPQHTRIKLQYKEDVFTETSIAFMGRRLVHLLEYFSLHPEALIHEPELVREEERIRLLESFNSSGSSDYRPGHLAEVFQAQAKRFPDAPALTEGATRYTYSQVNARANRLARLILERKTRENEAVGIRLVRSADLVIAILAVLKAGCAYVPVDPSYPAARKAYIVDDAQISILLTSRSLPEESSLPVHMLMADAVDSEPRQGDGLNPAEVFDPYSLAYIMYTSGSTGQPKGVMVEHHGVVNTLADLERRFPVEEGDVYLLKTAYTFDVSATELFGWFTGRGSLSILPPDEEKDVEATAEHIRRGGVTHINFVPSMFRLFLEYAERPDIRRKLESLKWISVGGEAVTPDLVHKYRATGLKAGLENVYGPTECSIWVSHYPLSRYEGTGKVPIGRPLNEARWYVVDSRDRLQPVGIPGELCLSGPGLARGYLNLDEQTASKFAANPFFAEGTDAEHFRRMYRTGDLVKWRPDGTIEYLDRIDFQVKLRGMRIELGEVENALCDYAGIVQAVVLPDRKDAAASSLYAYYLADREIDAGLLKHHMSERLPAYMVPSFFVHKTHLPKNTSGKIDRSRLHAEIADGVPAAARASSRPVTGLEQTALEVWEEVLGTSGIGMDESVFDRGATSLSVIQAHYKLQQRLKRDFSIASIFSHPAIRSFAAALEPNRPAQAERPDDAEKRTFSSIDRDVAVVGMSLRVPGASDWRDFWSNLVRGEESIHFYEDDELRALGIGEALIRDPQYVKAKGRLGGVDGFDPEFFEYTPAEVQMMSPQLRLLYQGVWEALEDAGCPPEHAGRTGVFLGGSDDFEWYRSVLMGDADYSSKYQAFTLSTNHFLATRIAYKLNLKGPVFSALTGCSTSLVTPHLACQSLILGECDMAVAGGITIELPDEGGYRYEQGLMFAPDGHCRPFDAKAGGTVFSNGMGIAVLKRLQDAVRDGDHIYGVIKGSAVNNDGDRKNSFLAPSVEGQTEAVKEAYRLARIEPGSISYVEAHGTGTLLGDPIEVESLTQAFEGAERESCYLGSVKGNVGHTDTAAGVIGMLKVALGLEHRYIPGTVHYDRPNPKIRFADTPFKVSAQGVDWDTARGERGVLRAGINSFGVGGTNAHMIMEEAPKAEHSGEEPVNLLVFSAKTESALRRTSGRVMDVLAGGVENVSDAAWTLQTGRRHFAYRKSLALGPDWREDPQRWLDKLDQLPAQRIPAAKRPVYFMFPGQGSQYQGMGRDLYRSASTSGLGERFRRHADRVLDTLDAEERSLIEDVLYGTEDPQRINRTEYSQFALFMTGYALAQSLIDLGVRPDGMLGHSIGELAAAAVANVLELKDAVEIVRLRGRLMQKQRPGVMLAVTADAEQAKPLLEDGVWLSLINTSGSCVLGGEPAAIERMEHRLESAGIPSVRLKTSHAFHTPMMEEAAAEFERAISAFVWNEPSIPLMSNTSGTWCAKREVTQAKYWSEHILRPVLFEANLDEALRGGDALLIEVGAGRTLSTFARQHRSKRDTHRFVNLLRHPNEREHDEVYAAGRLGELWSAGAEIDWNVLRGTASRRKLSLPTYVFDNRSFPLSIGAPGEPASDEAPAGEFRADEIRGGFPASGELGGAVCEAYRSVFGFDTVAADDDFFALGGDSLKAVSLAAAIRKRTGIKTEVAELFEYPSPAALSAHLAAQLPHAEHEQTVVRAERREDYPLSSAQSRMFMQTMLEPDSLAYNLPSATLIEGPLDPQRVKQALEGVIAQHEILRTSFEIRRDEPVQIVHDAVPTPFTYTELAGASEEQALDFARSKIGAFDLSRAPLVRVELVKFGFDRHLLLFDLHHIAGDGSSVETITRDFNTLYFGGKLGAHLQYKDYAVWQRDWLQSDEVRDEREFWRRTLAGEPPVLELPTDFPRPPFAGREGGRVRFAFPRELTSGLMRLSASFQATPYMVMLSLWNIVLGRYSGQEDLIVGTPVAGRQREEWKNTAGMFVNMLAMRNAPAPHKVYADFLGELKIGALQALKNQELPFDALVAELSGERDFSRQPLFDVCFDYQNMEMHDLEIEGLRFRSVEFDTGTSTYDLVLTCREDKQAGTIEGFIEYSSALYERDTIEHMAGHLRRAAEQIAARPDAKLGEIELVAPEERAQIFRLGGGEPPAAVTSERTETVVGLFETWSRRDPDRTALIVSGGRSFTYRELNERANTLAWKLKDEGVRPGDRIGLIPARNEELIISLLAVLKAGAAYIPIDPGFPPARVGQMVADGEVRMLLGSKSKEAAGSFDGKKLSYDSSARDSRGSANPEAGAPQEALCVIFTSGSTGRAKGVVVAQSSMVNFIRDVEHRGLFRQETDRIISVTTLSFDIFAFETLAPLCTGRSLYLANEEEQLDPFLAASRIAEHRVTHLLSTVSRIRAFAESPAFEPALRSLSCILTGGENFPASLARELKAKSQARIYNMYGPTETTVWSTVKEMTNADTVTIGRPIRGTQIHIRSAEGRLQPLGVYGELCIGGEGVALGYLNRPAETADKFAPCEDFAGMRTYRTGDRARLRADGEIELLGRLDDQVKVRGYRVELREIEQAALEFAAVGEAAAATEESPQGRRIVLFCRFKPGSAERYEQELRSWLADKLPHYMQPSKLVAVERMPSLPNGKLDRGALIGAPRGEALPTEPVSWTEPGPAPAAFTQDPAELERMLVRTWREILHKDEVGLHERFFDIGGSSLGLMMVGNRLNEYLGRPVPMVKLFEHATIAALVRYLREPAAGERPPYPMPIPEGTRREEKEILTSLSEPAASEPFTTDPLVTEPCVSGPGVGDSEPRTPGGSPARRQEFRSGDIAVVGMAGRFPGAGDIDEFWRNIVSGSESITRFTDEELRRGGADEAQLSDPAYVKAKGVLEGTEYFDAPFFGYPYQESNMMDPQIRMLHQCAWQALEHAGCDPYRFDGGIGLFAGSGTGLPWMTRFLGKSGSLLDAFEAMTLNEKDYLTTRISYKLNLTGPSMNVQTACSTSLVAIHQAVQSLRRGECGMALAGGVSVSYPQREGYTWHEGMIYSRDGSCRPFSDGATGTVSGNGCGIVVLKPLEQALQDGDTVYAVVKGSAVNNDGMNKIGYTAPGSAGQAAVIEAALADAGARPEETVYLEAHGTGTKLGDPIEIEALRQAWRTNEKRYCALGSVKANIGHLDAAAGVAGFIKTVLVLHHRTLPPQIHYGSPNPMIDFEQSPFYINTEARRLPADSRVLQAAVSSFGIGGTNAHLILEQAPAAAPAGRAYEPLQILPFSAKSASALARTSEAVIGSLLADAETDLAQAAWTLQTGRSEFAHRRAWVAVDGELALESADDLIGPENGVPDRKRPLVFFAPGADASCRGMARQLYAPPRPSRLSEQFRSEFDRVLEACGPEQQYAIRQDLFRSRSGASILTDPALFAVQFASLRLLALPGVRADAWIGRGVGELALLAASGRLELRDAVQVLEACPPGSWTRLPGELTAELRSAAPRSIPARLIAPLLMRTDSSALELCGIEDLPRDWRGRALVVSVFADPHTEAAFADAWELPDPAVHLLPSGRQAREDDVHFAGALGLLWCRGTDLDWSSLNGREPVRKIALPTYRFDPIVHDHDVSLLHWSRALPDAEKPEAPSSESSRPAAGSGAAEEGIAERLERIWIELLGCEKVVSQDDFFELGGHSLKMIALASRIRLSFGLELPLDTAFEHSVFERMRDWIEDRIRERGGEEVEAAAGDGGPELVLLPRSGFYETSSAQKRMYVVSAMSEDSLSYNLASYHFLNGRLDAQRFRRAMDELVSRHEAFRTRFDFEGGELVQIVEDPAGAVIERLVSTEAHIAEEMAGYTRPFDLTNGPLIRIKLTRLGELRHLLFIDMHHIVADQSSIAVLLDEFAALYNGDTLPPSRFQYKEFAAWQNRTLREGSMAPHWEFWRSEFAEGWPAPDIGADSVRSEDAGTRGAKLELDLGEALSERINAACAEHSITPYMLMLAALKLTLWKRTGQTDLVVGTGVAGRRLPEVESIVGMFVNMLAVRSSIDEQAGVDEYLHSIRAKLLDCYAHQDFPYDELIERLGVTEGSGGSPLFGAVLNYINMGTSLPVIGDLEVEPWQPGLTDAKFDLNWTVEEDGGVYRTRLEYKASLFESETIERFGEQLRQMLVQLTRFDPERPRRLNELALIGEEERRQVVYEWNDTYAEYPRALTIPDVFTESVALQSGLPAYSGPSGEMDYAELDNLSNGLAARLSLHTGGEKRRVALMLERGALQIAGILAVLKLGCAYVPIDLEYPEERIAQMLADSGAELLLTETDKASDLTPGVARLSPEAFVRESYDPAFRYPRIAHVEAAPEDPAYVMYTSGSTGAPKGIVVSHRSVLKAVLNTNYIRISPEDRVLQLSNYAFDGSVFDIFGSLLNGAALVQATREDIADPERLTALIRGRRITVFFVTTALFNMLVDWDVGCLDGVRQVLFGGEQASIPHVNRALERLGPGRLLHVYGPTETTFIASYYPLDAREGYSGSVPIGRALSNTRLYVLDLQRQPVPAGTEGELYIGGEGVAQGYLNREELTRTRFLPDPFYPGGTMYRTGDRVVQLPDGNLVFRDRSDFQVKIRGFRVELGEIEARIREIEGIRDTIVVAIADTAGSRSIAAYYTGRAEADIRPEAIARSLRSVLPAFMIPAHLIELEALPLTGNGKIDRRALPVPAAAEEPASAEAGASGAEDTILSEMRTLLGHSRIGVTDDFFEQGGQSLKAVALIQKLRKAGMDLGVNDLFRYPTAESLALLVEERPRKDAESSEPAPGQAANGPKLEETEETAARGPRAEWEEVERFARGLPESSRQLSALLSSAPSPERFPFAPIQIAHSFKTSRTSGFAVTLSRQGNHRELSALLAETIAGHQLLRSIAERENGRLYWRVCDAEAVSALVRRQIPYIDLRRFAPDQTSRALDLIGEAVFEAPYPDGELSWRLCAAQVGDGEYRILWGVDHLAFDGMSADIIARGLIERNRGAADHRPQAARRAASSPKADYSDYVSLLHAGPSGIEEADIVERYGLEAWRESSRTFPQSLASVPDRQACELCMTLPVEGTGGTPSGWEVMERFAQAISAYAETAMLPAMLVHYGREYGGRRFYDCVGEFLDLVPLAFEAGALPEEEAMRRIGLAKDRSINFMSLAQEDAQAERFPMLCGILRDVYASRERACPALLLNFQGFVPSDRAPIHRAYGRSDDRLAEAELVVYYDEERIYAALSCSTGLNAQRLRVLLQERFPDIADIDIRETDYTALEAENV
ncbi:amino acid adenylation domain-containing protein [Saccharibacillus sp. CPCC 101409]|uniref:non-ribosomal peptide synthetase/type I polyketide synthase n=1 Tax=Saccharibacillus sp. CPCC 101409 TaxID=3058041 RepID=UPI0026714A6A|nr:non-ribosomal peptide synthetase/type I polyketide synthase [Saccharibacillus sp. CPCC 101409]MDO3410500.1 amino acid adenylation domain-containing protein [Saccharibacillus sp. CPCC 101409]